LDSLGRLSEISRNFYGFARPLGAGCLRLRRCPPRACTSDRQCSAPIKRERFLVNRSLPLACPREAAACIQRSRQSRPHSGASDLGHHRESAWADCAQNRRRVRNHGLVKVDAAVPRPQAPFWASFVTNFPLSGKLDRVGVLLKIARLGAKRCCCVVWPGRITEEGPAYEKSVSMAGLKELGSP
jgi:hypothetical protein